jgi:hypothetical protein
MRRLVRVAVLTTCLALVAACSSGPRPVLATPEQIALVNVSESERFERLGGADASCVLPLSPRRLEGVSLLDLDCSPTRLTWLLREQAAAEGGDALTRPTCRSERISGGRVRIRCSAGVLKSGESPRRERDERALPGVPAELVARVDEPNAEVAKRILIDYSPLRVEAPRRPLRGDLVHEQSVLPVTHVALGDVIVRCAGDCPTDSLRSAVRIAAGRVGATDVVRIRCAEQPGGALCLGTAAAFERAPELDPRVK